MRRPRSESDCSDGSDGVIETKVPRFDSCSFISNEDDNDLEPPRANDRIDLVFVGLSDKSFSPAFTHQLFEDEKIACLSADERDARIRVEVNCEADLRQKVTISGTSSSITLQMLKSNLALGLPDDVVFNSSSPSSVAEAPSSSTSCLPVGKCVLEFTGEKDGKQYAVFLAVHHDEGAAALLGRAEKLAMWFIETADSVDFRDPRWEVLFLYRRIAGGKRHVFVGYTTLFTFHNPIVGDKLRVCQALIAPPCQGLGLGGQLLQLVYKIAAERPKVVEVSVEDPCPDFQRLRDVADIYLLSRHFSAGMSKEDARNSIEQSAERLKIVPAQMRMLAEMMDYVQILNAAVDKARQLAAAESDDLDDSDPLMELAKLLEHGTSNKPTDALLKALYAAAAEENSFSQFRLRVKRGFLKEDKELKCMEKEAMQRELARLFDERLERFQRLAVHAVHLGWLAL